MGGLLDSDPYYEGGARYPPFNNKEQRINHLFVSEEEKNVYWKHMEVMVDFSKDFIQHDQLSIYSLGESAGVSKFPPWECEIGYMNDANKMTNGTLLWDINWLEKKTTFSTSRSIVEYQFKDGFTDNIHKEKIMLQQLKENLRIAQNYVEKCADKASYKHFDGVEQVYLKLKLYKQDLVHAQKELRLLSRYLSPYKTKLLEPQQTSADGVLHIFFPAISEQQATHHQMKLVALCLFSFTKAKGRSTFIAGEQEKNSTRKVRKKLLSLPEFTETFVKEMLRIYPAAILDCRHTPRSQEPHNQMLLKCESKIELRSQVTHILLIAISEQQPAHQNRNKNLHSHGWIKYKAWCIEFGIEVWSPSGLQILKQWGHYHNCLELSI